MVLGASLDSGNCGVSALAMSLVDLIALRGSNVSVSLNYGHVRGGARLVSAGEGQLSIDVNNCRLSPSGSLGEHIVWILALALLYRTGLCRPALGNRWLRSLIDASLIGDVRGGDSFSDIYGVRQFVIGSLPLISVAILGKPYIMLPQSYGPFRSRICRYLASVLLRRARYVMTRDRNSLKLLQSLGCRDVRFCPDVAFSLAPRRPGFDVKEVSAMLCDRQRPLVCVNVSGLLYWSRGRNDRFGVLPGYPDLIFELVDSILNHTEATIVVVPHVEGEGELEACREVLGRVTQHHKHRVSMIDTALSEREVKWVIGRMDFVVASRMHACIAALSQAVPTIGLAYSEKFLGVFESAGVGGSIIDLRHVEKSAAISAVLSAFEDRHARYQALRADISALTVLIESHFAEIRREHVL